MVIYDDANLLDATGPIQVFDSATRYLQDQASQSRAAYRLETVARSRGPVRTSSGIALLAERSCQALDEPVDTLLVAGGRGFEAALTDHCLLAWLRTMASRVRRLASVCTGAFVLAEAGLLDGRRATTHWMNCGRLAKDYPKVSVEPDAIFVRDGPISTAAGVSSGIDLALAFVEEDFGAEIARQTARQMVVFLKRPGGQSQFSVHLEPRPASRPCLRELLHWIPENLTRDLRVEALAERSAMSPRNFARIFLRETEMSPGKFVEHARVESARRQLEESDRPITAIMRACGFGTLEQMRRTFVRQLGVSPSDYRSRFTSPLSPERQRHDHKDPDSPVR